MDAGCLVAATTIRHNAGPSVTHTDVPSGGHATTKQPSQQLAGTRSTGGSVGSVRTNDDKDRLDRLAQQLRFGHTITSKTRNQYSDNMERLIDAGFSTPFSVTDCIRVVAWGAEKDMAPSTVNTYLASVSKTSIEENWPVQGKALTRHKSVTDALTGWTKLRNDRKSLALTKTTPHTASDSGPECVDDDPDELSDTEDSGRHGQARPIPPRLVQLLLETADSIVKQFTTCALETLTDNQLDTLVTSSGLATTTVTLLGFFCLLRPDSCVRITAGDVCFHKYSSEINLPREKNAKTRTPIPQTVFCHWKESTWLTLLHTLCQVRARQGLHAAPLLVSKTLAVTCGLTVHTSRSGPIGHRTEVSDAILTTIRKVWKEQMVQRLDDLVTHAQPSDRRALSIANPNLFRGTIGLDSLRPSGVTSFLHIMSVDEVISLAHWRTPKMVDTYRRAGIHPPDPVRDRLLVSEIQRFRNVTATSTSLTTTRTTELDS